MPFVPVVWVKWRDFVYDIFYVNDFSCLMLRQRSCMPFVPVVWVKWRDFVYDIFYVNDFSCLMLKQRSYMPFVPVVWVKWRDFVYVPHLFHFFFVVSFVLCVSRLI